MAKPLLVLDEVLAMMEVVGIAQVKIAAFHSQANGVLAKRPETALDDISVSSGWGSKSQVGYVDLTLNNDTRIQMDVAKAREIAHMLVVAAAAAEGDAVVMRLMQEDAGVTDRTKLGQILLRLRELRQGSTDVVRPH